MAEEIPIPPKEHAELKFTSTQALKRSIRLKYPNAGPKQWKATFQDLKQYVTSKTTEEILDEKWEQYKKENNIVVEPPPKREPKTS